MDMYFETSSDMLSLNEMLEGDIKYSLEFGVGGLGCIANGGGASAGLSDDWNDCWAEQSTPSLSLDLLAVETGPGLMVNPKSVIPVKPYSHYNVQVNDQLKAKHDSVIIKEEPIVKDEPVSEEEKEEEEEESEEEEDDSEEEEEEDDDEEEEEDDDEEEQEIEWSSVAPKQQQLPTQLKVKPLETLTTGKPGPMIKTKRPQLKMQPTLIKVKQMETIIKQNVQPQKAPKPPKPAQPAKERRFLEDYPKPAYSYSCLIAMALKNSSTGCLPVSEIYNFMCEHFPYFIYAPSGWKNSVRHNLSLNKCFEKIEKGNMGGSGCRKGCLWAMNPDKITKMDDEVAKWSKKDPNGIRRAMRYPSDLERLEKGEMRTLSGEVITHERIVVSDGEDYVEEIEEQVSTESEDDNQEAPDSDTEDEEKVPPSLKPFDARLADISDLGLEIPDEMYEELGLLEEVKEEEIQHTPKRQRLYISPLRMSVRPVS